MYTFRIKQCEDCGHNLFAEGQEPFGKCPRCHPFWALYRYRIWWPLGKWLGLA